MNDSNVSRAPVVLGVILFVLVTIVLVVPRAVGDATDPSGASEQPVEIGGLAISDGDGTLKCASSSNFTSRTRVWDCADTRIMARTEATPNDQENAIARVYRAAKLAPSVDPSGVEHPRDGVWVKRSEETGGYALAAVSVADGASTRFFTIGGPDAHDLAERLVDAAPAEDSQEAQ